MDIGIAGGAKHRDATTVPAPTLPRRAPNTAEGSAPLLAALRARRPDLIVLEAIGNDHRPLLAALLVADLPVHVANPAQVAAFRGSRGGMRADGDRFRNSSAGIRDYDSRLNPGTAPDRMKKDCSHTMSRPARRTPPGCLGDPRRNRGH